MAEGELAGEGFTALGARGPVRAGTRSSRMLPSSRTASRTSSAFLPAERRQVVGAERRIAQPQGGISSARVRRIHRSPSGRREHADQGQEGGE